MGSHSSFSEPLFTVHRATYDIHDGDFVVTGPALVRDIFHHRTARLAKALILLALRPFQICRTDEILWWRRECAACVVNVVTAMKEVAHGANRLRSLS